MTSVWSLLRKVYDKLGVKGSAVGAERSETEDVAGCTITEPHEHLIRYFFPTPTHLPIADGQVVIQEYPGSDPEEAVPTAVVTVHQVEGDPDPRAPADLLAVDAVLRRLSIGDPQTPGGSGPYPGATPQQVTVMDVVTQLASPESADNFVRPQDAGPREDSLMRALSAAREVARAARLTENPRVVLPSYERLPVAVLTAMAVGRMSGAVLTVPPPAEWQVTTVVILDHTNIGGWEVTDEKELERLTREAGHWFNALKQGFPAAVAREHLIQAQRHLQVEGEYAQAVLAAATAAEVLCDALLSALLWEEHTADAVKPDATDAAKLFAKPKYAQRVSSGLMPRLRGNWNEGSPWVLWRHGGSRLRNRVIHTGYQPSRAEAVAAVDEVEALQVFLLDRLAARAAAYPRVAYMLLAVEGLEKRGAYNGQVKKFIETQADREPWWTPDVSAWHAQLIDAASALDE